MHLKCNLIDFRLTARTFTTSFRNAGISISERDKLKQAIGGTMNK